MTTPLQPFRRHAMLQTVRPRPVFTVRSEDGLRRYMVTVNTNAILCNCPAGEHGRNCKHARAVARSIKRRIADAERARG